MKYSMLCPVTFCLFISLLILIPSVDAFVFSLNPGLYKCFSEEFSAVERVQLHYKFAKSYASFVGITITAPDGQPVWETRRCEAEAYEMLTPHIAGDYAICFHSQLKAAHSASSTDVLLEIVSESQLMEQREYSAGASDGGGKQDRLKPLMIQANFVEHEIGNVHQNYRLLKAREMEMRDTNESTNERTTAVTVVTLLLVGVVSFLRFYTMKRHLQSKKILD